MYGFDLIQDFAVLLLAAGAAGLICRRLGLSAIVGFLLAGILLGPHTPPFSLVADEGRVMALSQVGLVFLMFGIGLRLSLSRFVRFGAGMLAATGLGAAAVLILTEVAGAFLGWTPLQAMFVAAMLMVSSSAVIAKVVTEQRLAHERASRTALAVTVLEDVVAVAMVTLLASRTMVAGSDAAGVGAMLAGLGAFVALLVGTGLVFVPWLLRRLELRADPEMRTLVVAGLMFGLAVAAAKAGYSPALGAFLLGAIVAELPQRSSMESSFRGLHDVFSSVFFVSIGMMIDPRLLGGAWPLVLGVTAFALVIRPLACSLALVAIGTSPREARKAGLLLTPLGEFSFIIAQLGVTTAVLPPSFYPVAVGASLLTILATPTVNRHRERVLRTWERLEPRFVTRALEAYHAWFDQLRNRPARTVLWKLVRPRLAQTAAELLFVSGLLIFAEPLFGFVAEAPFFRHMEPATFAYGFWSVVAFIVLLPLVAIWRNCAALAMLLGEGWAHARLPSRVIERALQAAVAFGLASWLYLVLPRTPFADLGWLVIAVGAAGVVALFSRHLVRWHSHWLASVREVLADRPEDRDEASLPVSSDHA